MLYDGDKIDGDFIEEDRDDHRGPLIIREEFDQAIKELSIGKAAGVDCIPSELIKNAGDKTLDILFNLTVKIYEKGTLPKDFTQSIIIPIPKKKNASKCEQFRTISLIPHTSKVILKILQKRISSKIDYHLGEDQFGFRAGRGTRDAVLCLRTLIDKRIDVKKKTYVAFIDLEKAFDRVDWDKLLACLERIGLDWKERRLIRNLYIEQEAIIKMNEKEIKSNIRRGVRQGCILSPLLFNIYIEEALAIAKESINSGIKINGEEILWLRFADDIAVMAENQKCLENILTIMDKCFKLYGMKINTDKTKLLITNQTGPARGKIELNGKEIEQVKRFTYLGSIITETGKSEDDVKARIAMAKKQFFTMEKLVKGGLSVATRKRLIKTYVWSVALYGSETWTLGKKEKDKLEAFEMWCWRKMNRIRWIDRKTNEEVLREIGEKRQLMKQIKLRKGRWIGHILRHQCLLLRILEGKIEGKRGRGRPRNNYLGKLMEELGVATYRQLKDTADNREAWRTLLHTDQP
jgi:hypothetical protein